MSDFIRKLFRQSHFMFVIMQILKPLGVGILSIILIIGIVALITELIEYEEIAKVVVIPCLVLLISVTGYSLFQTFRYKKSYKI